MIDKIIRGVITLSLLGITAYVWITSDSKPPPELTALMGIAIGQYIATPGSLKK